MKYLLVLLVVGLGLWMLLGRQRRGRGASGGANKPPALDANVIVPCSHCGVHLPAADAVVDVRGRQYCSEAHRRAAK